MLILPFENNNQKDIKVKNATAQLHKSLKGTVNTEIISHKYLFPQSPMANWKTKTPAEGKASDCAETFLPQKVINEQRNPSLMQD